MTSERGQKRRSGIFIINFEHISHLALVFLLWNLNMYLFALYDHFYISSIWWFQVSFIFREDFQEVEYFYEVECTRGSFKTMEWKMYFNKISL